MIHKKKIIFSLIIATSISLLLPVINPIVKACSGSFICGIDMVGLLNYISKNNAAEELLALAVYQKIITGSVLFLITLVLTIATHHTITKSSIKSLEKSKEDN